MLVLLFDLDHTLIHSNAARLTHDVAAFCIQVDRHVLHVHIRPHVIELLEYVLSRPAHDLRFGFWTAGTASYAEHVLAGLFSRVGKSAGWRDKVACVLTRDDTTVVPGGNLVKDLSVVRKKLKGATVLLVDDDPVHGLLPGNAGCVLQVPPFFADRAEYVAQDDCMKQFLREVRTYDDRVDVLC